MAHIGIYNTCRNAEAERKDKQSWIIIFFRGPYTVRSLARNREKSMGLDYRLNTRNALFITVMTSFALTGCGGSGNGGAAPAQNTGTGAPQITAPETTTVTTSSNSPVTNQTSATFEFSSNDANASFEVSLDGGGFVPATSPHTVDGLTDGTHTIAFRAVDDAGTPDPTPETVSWTVDTQPPETSFAITPQAVTTATDATFEFSSEPDTTFEVSLDGGDFESRSSPFTITGLTVGSHTLDVRATDSAANSESTTVSWEVIAPSGDTTPPTTSVLANVTEVTNSTSATFVLSSNESGVIFSGGIDGEAFTEITSPYTVDGLDDGIHTFEVSAIDPAGNANPTTASFTWTVDTTPPTVSLEAKPEALSTTQNPTFEFVAVDEPNSTFEGRLDGGDAFLITSPHTLSGLDDGPHTFEIFAIDEAGNESSATVISWAIDSSAPAVTVIFPPPVSLTDADEITVTGVTTGSSDVTAVRINGATAQTTDGFATWSLRIPIDQGENNISIEAEDAAGNVDNSSANVSIKVARNLFRNPNRIAFDDANNQVLVIDGAKILALDLDSRERTVVADEAVGAGPVLVEPLGIAIDSARNLALVTDAKLKALVAINLADDDYTRRVISDKFEIPRSVMVKPGAIDALVFDTKLRTLVSVDLSSGEHTTISDASTDANGPTFLLPQDAALDVENNQVLVSDLFQVIAIKLETGQRAILTGGEDGRGVSLEFATNITIDANNHRALVSDDGLDAIVAIELTDDATIDQRMGDRTIFSDSSQSGPKLTDPRGLAVDSKTGRIYIAEDGLNTILAANAVTGDRSGISDDGTGTGQQFGLVKDVNYDAKNNRLIALQEDPFQIITVDLDTGDRLPLPSGTGDPIRSSIVSMATHSSGDNAILLAESANNPEDAGPSLFSLDLTTGDRSILYNDFRDVGINFGEPHFESNVLFHNDDNTALVFVSYLVEEQGNSKEIDALVSVDLGTGIAIEISGNNVGGGIELSGGSALGSALDNLNNRIFIGNANNGDIIEINLETGQRALISSSRAEVGKEPNISEALALAFDSLNRRIVVVDRGQNALLAVDVNDSSLGELSVISAEGVGTGPLLNAMRGLTINPETGVVFLYETDQSALMAIEPSSGDRVILSK